MTPDQLITLAKRKNEAHKVFIQVRNHMRKPTKYAGMTEADRDIDMEAATREQREAWENLCDEWTVRVMEYGHAS